MTEDPRIRRRRIRTGCENADDTTLLRMLRYRTAQLMRMERIEAPEVILEVQRDLVNVTRTVARERGLVKRG